MIKIAKKTTFILLALMAFSVISIAIPQASAVKYLTAVTVGSQDPFPVVGGNSAYYTISSTWGGSGTGPAATLSVIWTGATPAGVVTSFSQSTISPTSTTSTLTISTTSATPKGQLLFFNVRAGAVNSAQKALYVGTQPVTMTVSYTSSGGTAPVFKYTDNLGIPNTYTLTTIPTSKTVGLGTAWSVTRADGTSATTLSGSTSTEQWLTSNTLSGTASTTSLVFSYAHQYKVSFEISPSDGGSITTPSSSSQWYSSGVNGQPIASSANPGYGFTTWSTSNSISFANLESSTTTMTVNEPGTVIANFAILTPSIQSSNVGGANTFDFTPTDTIYTYGSGYTSSASLKIYIVIHQNTWPIDASLYDIRSSPTVISANPSGELTNTALWIHPMPGLYDIVVDTNNNQKYDAGDAMVFTNVTSGGTGGFFVVPEYTLGGLVAIGACFAGFAVFKKRNSLTRLRLN